MASGFLDLPGLSRFKDKLLTAVDKKIDADASRVVAIEQLVGFYNGYNGTSLNYRDYLTATNGEVIAAIDAFTRGYEGTA